MAAKSIVDIDVNDDKFQEFLESFREYKAALAELPEGWREVGEQIAGGAEDTKAAADNAAEMTRAFSEGVASINALRESVALLNSSVDLNTKSQTDFNKQTQQSNDALKGARSEAKGIAGHIKEATSSLLSWTSIVGVLGAIGGAWGLGRMANGAAAARFNASGANTTTAARDAADVNLQGLLSDPSGVLSKITDVNSDLSRRGAFSSVGVNYNGGDPAEVLPELMRNARKIFKDGGGTQQVAESRGLLDFFSMQDLNRMKNASDQEFEASIRRMETDRRAMSVTDAQLKQWNDLNTTLDRSGVMLKNTFIAGLAPLADKLGAVSEGFSEVTNAFLKSPIIGELIDDVAAGLGDFASYLGSGEIKTDIDNFVGEVSSAYTAMKNFVGGVDGLIEDLKYLFSDKPGQDAANWIEEKTGWNPQSVGQAWQGYKESSPRLTKLFDGDFVDLVSEAFGGKDSPGILSGQGNPMGFLAPPPIQQEGQEAPEGSNPLTKPVSKEWNQTPRTEEKKQAPGPMPTNTKERVETHTREIREVQRDMSSLTESLDYKRAGDSAFQKGTLGYQEMMKGTGTAKQNQYDDLIDEAARRHDVNPNYLKATIQAESNFNEHAVSQAGAMGLGQVMKDNVLPGENMFNPKDNIEASARVMAYSRNMATSRKGGEVDEAFRYYNGGGMRGSKENIQYPGRVRDAYKNIFGTAGAPPVPERQAIAQASGVRSSGSGSNNLVAINRETNTILRDLLRTVQDNARNNVSSGSAGGSTRGATMDSKLLGGFS